MSRGRSTALMVAAFAMAWLAMHGADAGLVHRWSFSESGGAGTVLVDSVGGANATIVDLGGNDGTVGGGQVTLAGGAKGSSDYVSLPANLLTGLSSVTIETWATQHSVQNWSRVFDFGQDTTNNLLMSWTRGTNLNTDRAGIKIGNVETSVDERMAPYTLSQQFQIVMTVETGGSAAGQTHIHLYKDGVYRGTRITQHALTSLNDVNNFLGRSQYGDNTANASWNEFRIYDKELQADQILDSYQRGPDTANIAPPGGLHPLRELPIHRWSFSETGGAGTTLIDSLGGAHGTIVDGGANDGAVGGGQVTLTGGAKGSSDYVQLPAGLVSSLSDATIETWATQHSVQNWSRIFDFGENTTYNMLMAWTRGTDLNRDRAGIKIGTEQSVDDLMAPYTLGQEYHIVMCIDEDAAGDGRTLLTFHRDGELMGGRFTDYTLGDLLGRDINNWLGRSQYGDNTANASWDEFRIYDYVLSTGEIMGNYLAGPDQLGLIPEPGTLALLGLGLGALACRRRRRTR